MRFLILFIFLCANSFAQDVPFNNIKFNKDLKKYDSLTFLDEKNQVVDLKKFRGNLVILNFWATWCAPCKEEMPSLDVLQKNQKIKDLKIIPINIGKESLEKTKQFYNDIDIVNLELYFDNSVTLAKKLSLRGIPTTILFNKKGEEFARIIGSINFEDEKFIEWLALYD
tara:strand:+ start:490 stop:996 length:507 start_codon:yes stop_codon:yes gene_type:complete